ncbi:MAG TPA: GTPase Era [Bryobacteraceae bacterium]|nr:GTPase Era [Bryobacteraceae bacterium]
MSESVHRSGLVSLMGRPNSGKSTLLNALLGEKVAIVSGKPQTTRTIVQGALTLPDAQIVFLDTPGIHKSESLLDKRMISSVREAAEGRDLLLFLSDGTQPVTSEDAKVLDLVKKPGSPILLVLTKIDKLRDKSQLLHRIKQYQALYEFAAYIPISAVANDGLDVLLREIIERLPEGPELFPPDYLTDQPERFLAAEIIREKILLETRQEVPHSVAVLVDRWEDAGKILKIAATIYVERPGQKGIIIGSRGTMLKTIGTAARQEIEALVSRKIFLQLVVKEKPGWREDPAFLNELDWRSTAGF